MRISDRLLVQQVDDQLVFVDDSTGHEQTVPIGEIPLLVRRLDEAHQMNDTSFDLDPPSDAGDGVPVYRAEFAAVSFALGYFWRGSR